MGVPWRKIFGGIKKGLAIGAQFEPHIALVNGLIEGVERSMPDKPGADKKATVIAVSDAILESELAGLTPEQEAAIRDARSAYIDLYVQARNLEAQTEAAYDRLQAAIKAVKQD